MRLFVGNLSYHLGSGHVRRLFDEFGEVESAEVVIDHFTGRSRGYAYVEMASESEAEKAITQLDNLALHGRTLKVVAAAPPKKRVASTTTAC